ncbi:4Fe-4S binding protein [Neptunomonas antarctica]|uniref:4Fe-4S binding domain-containing protein n=1 Tax=Neptunomonas antarctica TaxID=619304 RepID=A0A1N7NCR4_9GAMM|nr:4Fe-4S binding protein [Neptunomonas antarctica]SIS96144.1 4Fe-4S binding domain-containing protein [Neptunomonas antarctica]
MKNEQSLNNLARQAAQQRVLPPHNLAPATVGFSTQGHLLITGSEDMIRLAADQLQDMASITLLCTEAIQNTDNAHIEQALAAAATLPAYQTKIEAVKGFLGQFQVSIRHEEQSIELAKLAQNRATFDLILNLGKNSLFTTELAPAGYFHIAPDADNFSDVIQQLPEYIGEFEKPRYFQVNQDICAHSNRGQTGCTRCLDVCPANAISSIKDLISIDPYLCHGAGGCSTACPTGAITYTLPKPTRLLDYLHKLLHAYKEAGGTQPALLLHDHEQGQQIVTELLAQLPGNIIPIQLEELAAAGQEIWLSALAAGVSHILLLDTPTLPESMRALLTREVRLTQIMLSGLGYSESRLQIIDREQLNGNSLELINSLLADQLNSHERINSPELLNSPEPANNSLAIDITTPTTTPAAMPEQHDNKRDVLFAALDQLIAQAPAHESTPETPPLPAHLTLPAGSPFGQVSIDPSSCTLCLSCVAVCPTQALTSGGEKPALNFTEQNCVQCNLCERACPENAITLEPRLLLSDTRKQAVEIHADEAFECITCSMPFAPRRTIDKMLDKLSEHRMFQGAAINRLKMCADCRVKDIYTDLNQHPEKQLEL